MALLCGVGVLSGVAAIGQALALALVVGAVVRGTDATAYLLMLVGLLALRGALAAVGEVVARRAGLEVVGAVRMLLLRRWLRAPEEGRPAPEVAVTRIGEGVGALEAYVARYLPALVTAAVVPALALVALLLVDPWSALIVVLTLPLLPVFAALIGMHTREETTRRWGAMTLLSGHFLDVMRGLPTLVAYGRARAQVDVVREVGDRHRRATVATLRTAFLSSAALELLATISVAMVAVAVGLRLAYGAMDLVVGLTAILLAPEAYWPVRRVGAEFHSAADGAAVLEDLVADGVLDAEATAPGLGRADRRAPRPDPAAPSESGTRGARRSARAGVEDLTSIGLTGVSYAHLGRLRTLADLTLACPAGPGLTSLTGPSGAGKTTVLELLAGLRTPAAGSVQAPTAHLATQRPLLLPGTVGDNLRLALGDTTTSGGERHTEDDLVDALRTVGLWDQLAARDGLSTPLGDDGLGLSAGQRARLALARALLSPAPLVLLDEPTAGVSAASLPQLHEVILTLAQRRRVVVVTHDPVLAAMADDRWVLSAPPTDGGAETVCHIRRQDNGCDTPFPHHHGASAVPAIGTPGGRRGLVLACLLGGASVSCGVALTATSGWLIVQASTMPVVMTLLVAIVGVRAFGIFRPVLRYAERVVSHDVALEQLAQRRAGLFAALVPLTPARLGRRGRGDLLTAVARDLDDVVDEQVRVVVPAWSALIASLVGAALAAWHLPDAGAVVLAGAVLTAAIGAIGSRAERAAQAQVVRHRSRVRARAGAVAAQLLAVQAITGRGGDHTMLLDPVRAAERELLVGESRLARLRAAALLTLWLVVAGTALVVAALTWRAHADGTLSAPYAALVTLIPFALADTWVGVADIAGAHARARAATARLDHLLARTPAVAGEGTAYPRGTVRLEGVSARWEAGPGAPDLGPLDLSVRPGDRLHLTGPNGVGKSTALAVLARQLDPAAGRYAVGAVDARGLDLADLRGWFAVVDDEPHAFAGTVRANLALAAPDPDRVTDEALVAALLAVDLGGWLATLPEGLDTRVTGLSGGERARLSLARALLSRRRVVLLDEPVAHLDDATAGRALGGLLEALPQDHAVVLVSHLPPPVGAWDRVALPVALDAVWGAEAVSAAGATHPRIG